MAFVVFWTSPLCATGPSVCRDRSPGHKVKAFRADGARTLLQAYYMMAPFAVERAPTVALYCLRKHRSVHVAMLTDYPVRRG